MTKEEAIEKAIKISTILIGNYYVTKCLPNNDYIVTARRPVDAWFSVVGVSYDGKWRDEVD